MRSATRRAAVVALALASGGLALRPALPDDAVERGTFTLYKLSKPVGEEHWELARSGDSIVAVATFSFYDRRQNVTLSARLEAGKDLAPRRLVLEGDTSRFCHRDLDLHFGGERSGFGISGYAPISFQGLLVRHWKERGRPASIPTLPEGAVTIEPRGRETFSLGGKPIELERFTIGGLIWGRETLWLQGDELVALVTVDAELDRFEALRPDLGPLLPELRGRATADALATFDSDDRAPRPVEEKLAIAGARLIDGTGRPPVDGSLVLVEGDRIAAVGSGTTVPEGFRVIDGRGLTLIPGLIDMHAHYEQIDWGPVYLASGITTVRDCGNELDFLLAVRGADAMRVLRPRILIAGLVDGGGPGGWGTVTADTAAEARAVVARFARERIDQVKVYDEITPEVLAALATSAHARGMTVTGHVPGSMTVVEAVLAGLDQVSHAPCAAALLEGGREPADLHGPWTQHAIEVFRKRGTVLDPTLAVYEIICHPRREPVEAFEPGAALVPAPIAAILAGDGVDDVNKGRMAALFESLVAYIGALHRAGVPIFAGTDQAVPGHSLARELELYVKAGLSPLEALQAATLVPARVMKLDSGTIEKGKRADLVLLGGDPLVSISAVRKVRTVIAGGRVLDPDALWRLAGFRVRNAK